MTQFNDMPKTDYHLEDQFRYGNFAVQLASKIIELNAEHGYVIGITGDWGSGKSTVMNFCRQALNEQYLRSETVTVIEFKPWLFSGRDDLISAFFKVFEEYGDTSSETKSSLKNLSNKLKKNSDLFAGAAGFVGLDKLAEAIQGRILGDQSLQAQYDNIFTQLKKEKKRYIVFVDDIDRLEAAEIKSLFQMVKSVGRLPNVVYVLFYDKDIVRNALDGHQGKMFGRPEYSEKIVQLELPIPTPPRTALVKQLESNLSFMGTISLSSRWSYFADICFKTWIKRPRDVLRLINAVKFIWPSLQNDIDAVDLVAMEACRVHKPELFDWIRENGPYLCYSEGLHNVVDSKKDISAALKKQIPTLTDEDLEFLRLLFPGRHRALGASWYSTGENHSQAWVRKGIDSPNAYNAYFRFNIPDGMIRVVEIENLIEDFSNYQSIIDIFKGSLRLRLEGGGLKFLSLLNDLFVYMKLYKNTPFTISVYEALIDTALNEFSDLN